MLNLQENPFVCEVQDAQESVNQLPESDNFFLAGDCQLRQYRLALACTGEYAQFRDDGDDTNGDIVADVMAAMVISMNRVNGVFEREVGVNDDYHRRKYRHYLHRR